MSSRCGTVPVNARRTSGSSAELPNLRTAFRWAADRGDIDTAAAIAISRDLPRLLGRQSTSRSRGPRRSSSRARGSRPPAAGDALRDGLAVLLSPGGSMMFVAIARRALAAIESGRYDDVPDAMDATLHGGYMMARARVVRRAVPHSHRPRARGSSRSPGNALVFALTIAGLADEAIALRRAARCIAEATDNPHLRCCGPARIRVCLP